MRTLLAFAWHYCPTCGSKMGVNDEGVETCPDRALPVPPRSKQL